MPNRIIRDGLVDSEAVNALNDWAHRFFSHLLIKCDDAGRFDCRVEVLRSQLFPLGTTRRNEDFTKALDDLEKEKLLIRYTFNGKPYLQLTKWQRCGKAQTSRFPWTDGVHAIPYVTKETRDGEKDFVATSLLPNGHPVSTPSAPHTDGVTTDPNTETETETETETKTTTAANAAAVAEKPKGKKAPDPSEPPPFEDEQIAARRVPSGDFQNLVAHFKSGWESRYPGVTYVFGGEGQSGRDGRHFKHVLEKVHGDLKRAKATVDAYLADESKYLRDERHPIALLVSGFNKHQAPAAGTRTSKVLDKAQMVSLP